MIDNCNNLLTISSHIYQELSFVLRSIHKTSSKMPNNDELLIRLLSSKLRKTIQDKYKSNNSSLHYIAHLKSLSS